MKYKWFKGVAQAVVPVYKDGKWNNDKYINAPMGFIEALDDEAEVANPCLWDSAILNTRTDDGGESTMSYTAIRGIECVYLYADGLVSWKDREGRAGKAMSPAAYKVRAYLMSAESRNAQIDRNELRPLLMAWLIECYNEARVNLDTEALSLTGRRVDDFISRIGKDKAANTVRKTGKMVTGNRETVTKSGAAFMRELCRWTVSVTQMKYHTVTRIEA